MKKSIILILLLQTFCFPAFAQAENTLKKIADELSNYQTYESKCSYTFSFPYGDPMTIESTIITKKEPADTLCGFYYYFKNPGDVFSEFSIFFNSTIYRSYKGKIEKISQKEKPHAFIDRKLGDKMIPAVHHNHQLYFVTPYQIADKINEILNNETSIIQQKPDTSINNNPCLRFILTPGKSESPPDSFNLDMGSSHAQITYDLCFDKNALFPVYYHRVLKSSSISQFQTAHFIQTNVNPHLDPGFFSEENLLPKNWQEANQNYEVKNPGNLVGKKAPDWSLPVLNEDTMLSNKNLLGKYVLLEFTATWCGHCIEAGEMMNRLEEKFRDNEKIALVSIFSSEIDKKEGISEFARKNNLESTILYSAPHIGELYKVSSYPNFIIISPEGNVLMNFQGYNSTIEKNITSLLTELTN
jgi:thiol-disulfide isomerase/thioredoxin